MRLSTIHLALLVPTCLVVSGHAALAQAPTPVASARPAPPQQSPLRSQISIMEGILERAVGEGIRSAVNQMPDLFQGPAFVTPPQAQGFRIDGYGVFFHVEVPALPASMTWSLSVINRNNEAAIVNDLTQLRAMLAQAVPDEARRAELRKTIDRVQQRTVGAALSEPGGVPPSQPGTSPVSSRNVVETPVPPRDPDDIYTSEVQKALVSVMLEQGISIQIEPDQWFTVAANQTRAGWGDAERLTLYLSIKGRDLSDLRARRITTEEAAKRIIVKNY